MQFDDSRNITFSIADKNETGRINISKQIRSVPITTSITKNEGLGIPNLPSFKDTPFCFINNPQHLKAIYSNFSDVDLIELSIGNHSIIFKGQDEMDKVTLKARYHGSGNTKILRKSFRDASDICELKSIKQTRISISKEGSVWFSHILDNGLINYYLPRAIE